MRPAQTSAAKRPAAPSTPAGALSEARAATAAPLECDRIALGAARLAVMTGAASVAAFLAWAATTEIDTVTRGGGVVASGVRNQTVQHLEGGIVAELLKREGDRVTAGEPIVRVIDSRAVADLEKNRQALEAKLATLARLEAEAAGTEMPRGPAGVLVYEAERALHEQRLANLEQKRLILEDQIHRRGLELAELRGRLENTEIERDLTAERVQSLTDLARKGAVSRNDLLSAMSELQQIRTRVTDLQFRIPQVEAELSETRRRVEETVSAFRAEASEAKSDVALDVAQLRQDIAALEDRRRRGDVTAPTSGIVNKMLVGTVGGVLQAGQAIAEIVPDSAEIVIDARLAPEDRARVWPGMAAVAKITAYDADVEGALDARIEEISADALTDERGQSYFRVRLSAAADGYGADKPVLPGMVVTVDMLSGARTVLATLTSPLTTLTENAFRE